MAGHSKWSKVKRIKAVTDVKKAQIFTKLIREITVAARQGGGDPDGNPRLRSALVNARVKNLPADNIDRAIKKGTGDLEGVRYDEVSYEGYGPGGVAVIMDVMTDNKNRVVPEIRSILGKFGGNLGETGSVSWNFETKGLLLVKNNSLSEDEMMELALDAGALDVKNEDDSLEIFTEPYQLPDVKTKLEEKGVQFEVAQISKLPKSMVSLDKSHAEKMIKLIDALEDNDDVQNVWTNAEFPDEVLKSLA